MTFRYQLLPPSPPMDREDNEPATSPGSLSQPHFRKPSKPLDGEPHPRAKWQLWMWRLKRTKRRCWAVIGAVLTAGIIAAIVSSVASWKKRQATGTFISALQSDVAIWFNNDLHGASANNTDGVILLNRTMSNADAMRNCSALNEGLINAGAINATAMFEWFTYMGDLPTQAYWVGAPSGDVCNAMSNSGPPMSRPCSDQLPAVCGSRAPIANQAKQDTSGKWQISVNSRGQELKGYRDKRSFRYMGVRYAEQPVRFNHSTPYAHIGTFDATQPGSICQQGNEGTEDCLFLNIWTPYLPRNGNDSIVLKPVMFWLHGGAFEGDSGTDPTFDGGNWASRGDVVTVTINYRLGNLGFLVINGTSATGNYGFGDQITALDWVRDHIKDFGGDPDRITVAGQSAGAASVRAMLGSPMAAGKFSAAILQSSLGGYGFAKPYSSYMTMNDYQANFTDPIMNQINCDGRASLPCAQKTSARTLTTVQQAAFLVQDDIFITSSQLSLNDTTETAKVPVIMGQMQGDAVFFVDAAPDTANLTAAIQDTPWNSSIAMNPDDFPIRTQNDTLITDTSGNSTYKDDIAAVYNVTVRAGNDAMFRCVDQATAYAAAENDVLGPLWYYEMQRSYITYPSRPACNAPVESAFPYGNPAHQTYKCHTGDNVYTFGNLAYTGQPERDGEDFLFSQLALDSWTSFVRTHDPNPDPRYLSARGFRDSMRAFEDAGRWPPIDSQRPTKRLLSPQSVGTNFDEYDQCVDLDLPLDMFV